MKTKEILIFLLGVGLFATSFAQSKIYGTLGQGYQEARTGGYYSINADGSDYTQHDYDPNPIVGKLPFGELLVGQDERLYGTTGQGGSIGFGVLYSFNQDGTDYKVLHEFGVTAGDGNQPLGRLTQLTTGEIVGVTFVGGSDNRGILYKVNPDGSNYKILLTFQGVTNGGNALEGPILANNGKLIGTVSAGADGGGGIYQIDTDGNNFKFLWKFDSKGGSPYASVIQSVTDGYLYGTTYIDETSNPKEGSVFKIKLDGTGFSAIHLFSTSNGKNPLSGVIEGSDGVLYGQCFGNLSGNVVYKVNRDGTGFSIVHTFTELTSQGVELTRGQGGKLYGMTSNSLFRVSGDGTAFETIKTFDAASGVTPLASLTALNDTMYGTLALGGSSNAGTVFSFSNSNGFKKVLEFGPHYNNGLIPSSGLTKSSNGTQYGISKLGAGNNSGAVYSVDNNLKITKLADLPVGTGAGEYHGNLVAADNRLCGIFGSTGYDEAFVFSYKNDGTDFKKILTFDGSNDASPNPLTTNNDGFIYGSTHYGGTEGLGVVYKIKPDGSGYTALRNFSSDENGANPFGSLTISSDGFIYGYTITAGENDYGTIYRMKTDGSSFSVLGQFNENINGLEYQMKEYNGQLYGVSSNGGENGQGFIFKMNLDGTGFTSLFSMDDTSGYIMWGSIAVDTKGNIYAASGERAKYQHGALFTIKSDGSGFKVVHDFEAGIPQFDLMIEETVGKEDQTISFNPIPGKLAGDAPFNVVATASSGLPVSFTSNNSSVAVIEGSRVTIKGAGTARITASQAGSDSYNAAADVVRELVVEMITGLGESYSSQAVVYPNPVSDTLFVKGDEPIIMTSSANIIPAKPEATGDGQYRVDMSSMAPGLYLVIVNGKVIRIVKR